MHQPEAQIEADQANLSDVSVDDNLKTIEGGRGRIRNLGTIVGTSASLVVTVSTAILAYIYKADAANTGPITETTRNQIFGAIALAVAALACVVGGFLLQRPFSVRTKADLVSKLTTIYKREQSLMTFGALLLFAAMVMVALGTWTFVDIAEPKANVPAAAPTATVLPTP